ncbi:MAG: M6 family metalloprotease domain-containing protein [Bacteroidales bacterium]|nr:M6 family metalloprotease domain-containing protein [Bacteroidales bacterium]
MNKIPMLRSILVSILFSLCIHSYAAWINFEPQTITQPDGTVIHCFATGDEFYNWLHDENGFTIIQNHTNGFYYYAILEDGKLIPSQYRVNAVDPAATGIKPWTNISPEKMQSIRAEFFERYMPEKTHLPGYNSPKSIKNEGVLNNLVVYIRFSDQAEFSADTMEYYNIFNSTNSGYNSMQNYFETVSYGMISIPSWFYPQPPSSNVMSYQDIFPRNYFMPYDPVTNPNGYQSGESGLREHALLKRACQAIETEVPASLNIDKNNDGYIDNMVFIVRGATTAWATLLWPHRWVLYNETVYINGKRVWDYNLQVEDHLNNSGPGVLCHEMFHSLSAPDLYHYNSAPYVSVGPWDLMDNNHNPPQSMGAYMKYRYGGWIESIPEITECGTYSLSPLSEQENNCFKIVSPNNPNQYFVFEYRVKAGTFEGSIPGTGLLVYRIDNTLSGEGNAQGPPDEVYLYRPGGTTSINGDLDNAHFGADYGRTEINDNTNPSSFLQNGQPGGLNISNVGYVDETISFDVYFEKEPVAEFSSSETLVTVGCTVNFEDLSICQVDSWLWTFDGGTPATSGEQHPQGVVYNTPGIYTVSLTATNPWGSNTITKAAYIELSTTAEPGVVFFASDSAVCTGATITLMDYSTVCPESWNWLITPSTFEYIDGTNASSQNPEIQLNSTGPYSVSLTVTNNNGSATLTKEDYIYAGGNQLPFAEDFESGEAESKGWSIVNPDNDAITWDVFPVDGNGGNYAAGIKLYDYFSIFKRDQLISPPIDLSGVNYAVLSFEHAYALKGNPTYSDSLIVKISTDCGESWERILELADDGNGSFATHEPFSFSFVPAILDDWCGYGYGSGCYTVDISPWAGTANVQVMFETVRVAGNNLYIDNVSVSVQTGEAENEIAHVLLFDLYPNPTSGLVNISLRKDIESTSILIYNLHGQLILTEMPDNKAQSVAIDLSNYPKGLYFIHLLSNGEQAVKKVVVE